jgi:hypothetical protein
VEGDFVMMHWPFDWVDVAFVTAMLLATMLFGFALFLFFSV